MEMAHKSVLLVLLVCGLLALASAAKHPEDDRHHRPGSEGRPAGGEHHHGSEGGEHHHGSEGSEPHHGHPRPEPEGDDAEGEEDSVSTATDGDDVPGIVEDEIEHVENDLEDKIASFWRNSKNKLVMAVYNLSEYLPISVEYATSVAHQCDLVANNRKYYTKVGLIISAVMLLSGLLFAFLGYRLIKLVLFLIGFGAGGALTYFIVLAFTADMNLVWIPYVAIGGAVIVGAICGAITICIYYIGIFLAGAGIGFLVSWFVLAAIDIAYFQTHIWIPVLIAVAVAVLVGIVTLFIQKWFFMIGTSVLGAFKIAWALDYFLELGSMMYYLLLFAERRAELKPCWYSWCMIGVFVVVAITAFLVQALLTGRKYDHRKDFRGICCGVCSKKKRRKTTDQSGDYMDLKTVSVD